MNLLSPLSPIVRVNFLILVSFLVGAVLSHPDVAFQILVTVDNPVCMNDEIKYVTEGYFCLKCLFPVNIRKKKLSCSLITKTNLTQIWAYAHFIQLYNLMPHSLVNQFKSFFIPSMRSFNA